MHFSSKRMVGDRDREIGERTDIERGDRKYVIKRANGNGESKWSRKRKFSEKVGGEKDDRGWRK